MLGPNEWTVKRKPDKLEEVDNKSAPIVPPRNEPAATDLRDPRIVRFICATMADDLQALNFVESQHHLHEADATIMYIPKAMSTEMQIVLSNGERPSLHYGAYVVHASRYGVPKQRGLRDYWRHAFLFKERAVMGAALELGHNTLSPDAQQVCSTEQTQPRVLLFSRLNEIFFWVLRSKKTLF